MKIIIPERIQTVTAAFRRLHQTHVLWFVFRDDDRGAPARGRAYAAPKRHKDVLRRIIIDALRRIEPQTIEMKLFDPVGSVGEKVVAHRFALLTIVIDGFAPFGFVFGGEVSGR